MSAVTVTFRPAGQLAAALGGARAMVPWLVGVAPFGLVIGVSAAQADVSTLAGWLTGPLLYGGSAQIATIELLDAGAAPLIVILSALIINLRLILYSGAMAPHWRDRPRWWRLLAGYLLVDPSFAVGADGYERPTDRARAHAHYIGGALTLWVAWLAVLATGAVIGTSLPAALQLEFAIPLYLVGEVVSRLRAKPTRRAALTAAAVSAVAVAAPLHLGLVAGILAGLAAGLLVKEVRR